MIIHNLEQGTDEWLDVRKGKFTASNANTISVNGKGLNTYALEVFTETIALPEPGYTNSDIERGNDLEDQAIDIYELITGNSVHKVGFVQYSKHIGCSPDGLVGDDGLVEVKCPKNRVFVEHMLGMDIPKEYYMQMQMQMFCTKRKWCDFIVYNPNFKDPLIIKRVDRDNTAIKLIKSGLISGITMLKSYQSKLNKEQVND